MPHGEVLLSRAEARGHGERHETMTQLHRRTFALLAISALQIGTLIHRKDRGGRQETPSILDMDLPNCRDLANMV